MKLPKKENYLFIVVCLLFGFTSLNATNTAPSITAIAEQTVLEDSSAITIGLNSSDIDDDVTHLSATISDDTLATLLTSVEYVQLGFDIDGEAADDWSGRSVSLSSDGSRVAIGAYANDGAGTDAGHVRIYDYNGTSWTQVGDDIDGEAASNQSGYSVSLSSDGSRISIGAKTNSGTDTNAGHVRIYDYNGTSWTQIGADIDGEAANDLSGTSVSLSSDGSRIAVGAIGNDGTDSLAGHVRVYEYSGTSWTQVGFDIDGEAADDQSGYSVSLSGDGSRIAVGAIANDGTDTNAGHVRIYDYNGTSWTQIGADIDGEAANDLSGTSVSLSSDGSRIAVGAMNNDGTDSLAGHVRVYEYSGTSWTQVGFDIDGEYAGDYSGYSISLSNDGSRISIGGKGNDDSYLNAGHVRIYDYNGTSWTQVGSDIDGEAAGDSSGYSVSFSSDGTYVAIGAPTNDGNGSNAGHVRVYELKRNLTITPKPDAVGTTTVTVTANDGTSDTNTSFTLNITNTNDIPSSANTSFTIDEDNSKRFVLNDFNFTDIDSIHGDTLNAIFITTLPLSGVLTLSDVNVTLNQEITDIVNLKFTPEENANGTPYATFGFKVNDGEANSTSAYVATMNVTAVDDAPSITTISEQTVLEDSSAVSIALNVNDVENDVARLSVSISDDSLATLLTSVEFSQLGLDIDGEAADDWSGRSVSLSSDGSRVAIGANLNDDNASNAGHARIYDYNGTSWIQVGTDIDGEATDDQSGNRVCLSSDGTRIAIGAPYNDGTDPNAGHVRIYDYNGTDWTQVGSDIDGEAENDQSGSSISFSSDGSHIAIGAGFNDGNGSLSGHVRIYNYNGTSWIQVGVDIDGEAIDDTSGRSVSLSANGHRIAIGATGNDDTGASAGHVRIYDYDGTSWNQIGADIDGEAEGDYSGISVSLSSDGSRIAIGAEGNDNTASNAGHVRIYDYNGTDWVQVGADIDGEAENDNSGVSVSLSSDGTRVAIGGYHNDGTALNAGHVRIYDYDGISWIQIGVDIDGEAIDDGSGSNISLSSDGTYIAIGAFLNDGSTSNAGHVRVYELKRNLTITPKPDAVGTTTVTVTANDGTSDTNTSFTLNITNTNDIPSSANTSFTIDEDNSKRFVLNDFNFTDIDSIHGDTLNAIFITTLPLSGVLTLSDVNVTLNQEITDIANLKFTPEENANGTPYATFGFKVNDGEANSTSAYVATMNVTAVDDAPSLESIANQLTLEDADDLNITLISNDLEGSPITYVVTSSNISIATVAIIGEKLIVTQVGDAYGLVNIEVNATANGLSTLKDFNLSISGINDTPDIDTLFSNFDILEDALSINLDINISDIEGDDLNLTVESNNTALLAVTQNYTNLLSQGNYDGLVLDFNLTAQPDANGIAEIMITLNDGLVTRTQSFEVNVRAVNDAPVLDALSNESRTEDSEDINITLSATDIDSTNLIYSAISQNESIAGVSVTDNILTISAVANAYGITSVDVNVTDGEFSDTLSFDVNITSVNDIPTITIDSTLSTDEDSGQSLTFSLGDVEDTSLTLAIDTQAVNGVVAVVGTDVTYTPNANYNGTDSFTLSTTDSNGATVTKTISVTVASVNDKPVVIIDSTLSTEEDGSASLSFSITDVDGDEVVATVTINPEYGTAVINGTTLTYTPTLNYNGSDSFTLAFDDSFSGMVQNISVNVSSVNDAPTISIESTIVVNEDASSSITFTYSDIDGDIVSASLEQSPANGLVEILNSNIKYTPTIGFSGNDSFIIILSDANGYVSMQTVNVTVLAKTIEIGITPTNTNQVTSQESVINENNSTTQITLFEDDDAKTTRVELNLPQSVKETTLAGNTVAHVVEGNTTKAVSIQKSDATVELIHLNTDENNNTRESKVTSSRENIIALVKADTSIESTSQMRVDENLTSSTKVTLRNNGTTLNEATFTQSDGTDSLLRVDSNIVGMTTELKTDGTTYIRTPKKVAQDGSESEVTLEITPRGTVKQTLIVTKQDGTQVVTPMISIEVNPTSVLDLEIVEEADGSVTLKTRTLIPESGFTREI